VEATFGVTGIAGAQSGDDRPPAEAGRPGGHRPKLDAAAQALNLSVDDLRSKLRDGKTLAQVARGAEGRIELAVGNLLDNAGKWSADEGRVEIAVRDGEISVRDHGSGIDPADAPFVFDRFWRAEAAQGTPGSGLGLAIVRQVADQHGTEVRIESLPGGGTLVRLRFPLLRA
jgi:signal transduction histidine kinase